GLSQGPHTFAVRATDAAGNTDPSPATQTWTVDTQAPPAPVITAPPNASHQNTQTVTLSGTAEAGSTVEVREGATLRGSATATGGNWTVNVAGAADGVHTYSVTARDAAGNESAPATRTVTIDTGPPPPPVITAGPNGPINTTTAQISFTGESGATFECVIDDEDPVSCASPHTYQGLSEGNHVFGVRQIDAAGNGSDPTARAFTVDLTPPAPPTVVSGPAGETTEQSPAFAFTSEAGTRVECRLDGPAGPGTFAACTSPHSFSGLAPGAYTLFIRSTDAAGNQRTTSRSFTVTAVQAAQQPTPTPTPSPTPTATPTPVPNQSVVVGPTRGTVLVKVKGSNRFEELDESQGIPVGSEVDARKGRVTLTAVPRPGRPPQTAEFYDGMFIVTQKGGITDLKLSEPLDCSSKRARASAKKPKKRRLWGKGSGNFRTTGRYSAATVRGTTWLVQDTCTTTLTRVTQGVVAVRDKVKRKTVLVKKGKRYTARKRR
ncbi:MAG TPA: Ig-like domain-containing protein, partial [Solirubrobacter sp.]|nr:Ig-like domain-containing protein [Solirubrobacter sp.]